MKPWWWPQSWRLTADVPQLEWQSTVTHPCLSVCTQTPVNMCLLLIPDVGWLSRLLSATTSKARCCFLISKIADWNSYRPVAGVSLLYYQSPFLNTCSLRGTQTYSSRSQTDALLCAVSLVAMPCNTLLVSTMKQLHRLSSFTFFLSFFLWELLCFWVM